MAQGIEGWFFRQYVNLNLAVRSADASQDFISEQLEEHRQDPTYTGILIDAACRILPALTPYTLSLQSFVAGLMQFCGDDKLLKQKVIVASNAIALDSLKTIGTRLATSLLAGTIEGCGDDRDLKQPIIDTLCKAISIRSREDYGQTGNLIKVGMGACRTDIQAQQQIIGASCDLIPRLADEDTYDARRLIEEILIITDKDVDALGQTLVGKLSNDQILLISRGGSEKRTNYALVTAQPDGTYKADFMVGCFRGTADQLVRASGKNHGVGSKHNLYYKAFVAAARAAGKHPETVLPMRETLIPPSAPASQPVSASVK